MAIDQDFPRLGFGVGLRRQHYGYVLERMPPVDWFEAISENFMVAGGRPLQVLDGVRTNYPLVLHGVSLSIGSTDPLDRKYLKELAELVRRFEPAWVSDHLCWTGATGRNLHDLLPLPYTDEAVRHAASRIRQVQDLLGRRILIENVSSYLTFKHSTLREWEFVNAVASEADCAILLDVNNIYVSACNHRFDPAEYIRRIAAGRVAQFHIAGHSVMEGGWLLDTHDHPVCDQVWELYELAVARFGAGATLLEWDDHIPEFEVLTATIDEARRRAAAATACAEPEDGTIAGRSPTPAA